MRPSLFLALAAAVASAAAPAAAHLGHVVLRAERYLKFDATPEEARVVVSLTMGAREAEQVLRAADADRSGDVTQAEADGYLREWAAGLRTELPITHDGEVVEAEWRDGWLEPIGRVREVPLTVELVAHVPLEPGTQTLSVRDAMARREVFDRTDVVFRTRDGATLVASGTGLRPPSPIRELTYGSAAAARTETVLTAIIRTPDDDTFPWKPVLGAAAALVLLLIGAVILRNRRA